MNLSDDDLPEVKEAGTHRLISILCGLRGVADPNPANRRAEWSAVTPKQYLELLGEWNGALRNFHGPAQLDNDHPIPTHGMRSAADVGDRRLLLEKSFDVAKHILTKSPVADDVALRQAGRMLGGVILYVHGYGGANKRTAKAVSNVMGEGFDQSAGAKSRIMWLAKGAYPWAVRPPEDIDDHLRAFVLDEIGMTPEQSIPLELPSRTNFDPFGFHSAKEFSFLTDLSDQERSALATTCYSEFGFAALYKALDHKSLVSAAAVPVVENGELKHTEIDVFKALKLLDGSDIRRLMEFDRRLRSRKIEIYMEEMSHPRREPNIAAMQEKAFEVQRESGWEWFQAALSMSQKKTGTPEPLYIGDAAFYGDDSRLQM